MEYAGIAVDKAMLEQVTKEMGAQVAALEAKAREQAGGKALFEGTVRKRGGLKDGNISESGQ